MADSADITLADVPDATYEAQQVALVRLLLYITGEIHRLINEAGARSLKTLREQEDNDLSVLVAERAKSQLSQDWNSFIESYSELTGRAMRIAASLPFGTLALQHEEFVLPAVEVAEGMRRKPRRAKAWTEVGPAPEGALTGPRDAILTAVQNRILGDGLSVSERVWNFDRKSRAEFDRILADGIANGRSAWETAGLLESYLGSGADCPRWTRARLYDLSKSEIAAGDATGLVTGSECEAQGVAYNALRLARNEAQVAFNAANDMIMAASPWIEGEQIVLSPEHPKPDECDGVAGGGEGNDGIYPKGSISLPLHVLCLCFKLAVLMDKAQFDRALRSWMKGGTNTAVSDYNSFIGGSLAVNFLDLAVSKVLAYWLLADDLDSLFWD